MIQIFIKWLIQKLNVEDIFVVSKEILKIKKGIQVFMDQSDSFPELSGEAKRSRVYGAYLKRHEGTKKIDIGIAIELSMLERK